VRANEKKNEQHPPLRSRPENETPFHQNRSRWQGNSWSRKISTEARTKNKKQLLWLQHSKVSDKMTKELKVDFSIEAQASVQSINGGHRTPSFFIGIKTKSCSWHTSTLNIMKIKLKSGKEPHPPKGPIYRIKQKVK
jgi:hypothetical protein